MEIDLKEEFEKETGQGIVFKEGLQDSDENGTYNDHYVEWLEQKILSIDKQHELLLDYHRYLQENLSMGLNEIWVDEYLKDNNCG